MSNVNSINCPKCKQRTSVETRATKPYASSELVYYEIGECNSCEQHFLVMRLTRNSTIGHIYPKSLPDAVDSAIPERIKSDLEEALICYSASAYRASAVMARRAMQNICLDKGAPRTRMITPKTGEPKKVKNDLINQIDWMYAERIITKELKDWAHEVRTVGNSGAHPASAEDSDEVSLQDAADVLDLVRAFCEPLYVASQKYADRRKRQEVEE